MMSKMLAFGDLVTCLNPQNMYYQNKGVVKNVKQEKAYVNFEKEGGSWCKGGTWVKIKDLEIEETHYLYSKTGDYEKLGKEIGQLVDEKNEAYGDSFNKTAEIIKQFLQGYKNDDGTYTIPAEMIEVISRQTRIIDKQSRIFNNPEGDLMDENPYGDIAGYGLLAIDSDTKD